MNNWPTFSFLDAMSDTSRGNPKTPQSEYLTSGRYAIVDQGKELVAGYTDDPGLLYGGELPVIVFGDHTRHFKYVDFPFCMGADGVKVLQPHEDWDAKFLYYYLSSLNIPSAGYSRHFKFLKEKSVPCPSITAQRRIAEVLDRADELRAKRRQALAQLDDLTQSIFLDMFAPGTPTTKLGDHLAFVTSGGRGWARFYTESGKRFIRSVDVGMNAINNNDVAYVDPPDNAEARRTTIEIGDVLLTITGSRIGRVAVAPPELEGAHISQHVAILRLLHEKIRPEFLSFYLSLPSGGQRQIASAQYGQTKPGLNFQQIREFVIPTPSLDLQDEFRNRIGTVRKVKEAQQSQLAELDALFASLQDRAFRGLL